MDFFRFPHTPHLDWLGTGQPRDDKLLSPIEVQELLAHEVCVEEKVDGANVGLSIDEHGSLQAQSRGTLLKRGHSHPQFKLLFRWLEPRRDVLTEALSSGLMLFGEWCLAVHSVRYTKLPDWFVAFDVYDRVSSRFWSTPRRDTLARSLGIELVPELARGRFSLRQLHAMLGPSKLSDAPAEGLYVRRDEGDWLLSRAKLVRPEFTQAIDEHWSRRSIETNSLAGGAASR